MTPSGKGEVSSLPWSDTESVNISWLRVRANDQDGSIQNRLPIFVIFIVCIMVWSFCLLVFVLVVFYCFIWTFEDRERENMGRPRKSCMRGKYMIKIYCIKILKANFKCNFKTGNFKRDKKERKQQQNPQSSVCSAQTVLNVHLYPFHNSWGKRGWREMILYKCKYGHVVKKKAISYL